MAYNFYPKKPVKSFQDLEVYQKALEASVFVANNILPAIIQNKKSKTRKSPKPKENENLNSAKELIYKSIAPCALGLPHLIAEAHSVRFGSQQECIVLLEKVMMNCNKMAVYLEQIRDICETGIEWEVFDELIKKYFFLRRKVLNLQRSWKKYMFQNKDN